MSNALEVQNRQRTHSVNCRLFQQMVGSLLIDLLHIDSFVLEINIVTGAEMTRLNETFLRHKGSTDVLTFDYGKSPADGLLSGEIFVCADEAAIQAARFNTTWQSELVRYVIHGVLHLMGYDDHRVASRRKMKRQEDRALRKLARRFNFARLGKHEPTMKRRIVAKT